MPDDVQILKVDEALTFDALGKPVPEVRVQFKIGVHGPFFRSYAKEGFSGYAVQQDLATFARELATLNGGV